MYFFVTFTVHINRIDISVSQTQASEEIRSAGLKVIGWYHSHPVFDPNPSVRDMETQLKFQVKLLEWRSSDASNEPHHEKTCFSDIFTNLLL